MKQIVRVCCTLSMLVLIGCSSMESSSEVDSKTLAMLNRDALLSDVEGLAKRAQMFYYRPASLGGGGQSFQEIAIDAIATSPQSKNGRYSIRDASATSAVIVGVGHEIGNDGETYVRVIAIVTKTSITTTVEN